MIETLGSLVELVESLIDELEAAGIPYALGGAIAYSAWGEPRATRDIDLNVWLDIERFEPAFAALERCGVTVDRERAITEARERGMFVARAADYRIDVFVPSVEFYDEALRQRRRVRLAGRDTWVLAPESLTVFKMLFFRLEGFGRRRAHPRNPEKCIRSRLRPPMARRHARRRRRAYP